MRTERNDQDGRVLPGRQGKRRTRPGLFVDRQLKAQKWVNAPLPRLPIVQTAGHRPLSCVSTMIYKRGLPVAYGLVLLPGSWTETGTTKMKKAIHIALQRERTLDHPSSETKLVPKNSVFMGRQKKSLTNTHQDWICKKAVNNSYRKTQGSVAPCPKRSSDCGWLPDPQRP